MSRKMKLPTPNAQRRNKLSLLGAGSWRLVVVVAVLLLAMTRLGAQSAQAPAQGGDQQPVFRGSTRLVVQNVYVKNKDGKAIQGLTAKDFTVFEDNQRQ